MLGACAPRSGFAVHRNIDNPAGRPQIRSSARHRSERHRYYSIQREIREHARSTVVGVRLGSPQLGMRDLVGTIAKWRYAPYNPEAVPLSAQGEEPPIQSCEGPASVVRAVIFSKRLREPSNNGRQGDPANGCASVHQAARQARQDIEGAPRGRFDCQCDSPTRRCCLRSGWRDEAGEAKELTSQAVRPSPPALPLVARVTVDRVGL